MHSVPFCIVLFRSSFNQKVNCEQILNVIGYNKRIRIYTRNRKGHDKEYLYSGKLEAFEQADPKGALPQVLREEQQQSLTNIQASPRDPGRGGPEVIDIRDLQETNEDLENKPVYSPHREYFGDTCQLIHMNQE